MDHCLSHETSLEHVRTRAKKTVEELEELQAWKVVQEKKLALLKQVKGELEKQTEVLEDKEKEITDSKDQLRRAKEDAIQEYRDSEALLSELGSSFANRFDDCYIK